MPECILTFDVRLEEDHNMEKLTLVKKDDRAFLNPFFETQEPHIVYPVTDDFLKVLKPFALNLLSQWEKAIKEQITYTGTWDEDTSVYTGIAGYALLYLDAGLILNNEDFQEQAFFLAEKCAMHQRHHSNGKDLTFLTGAGGPFAIAAVCAHVLHQPEKEKHFINKLQDMYYQCKSLMDGSSKVPSEILYGRAGVLYSLLFVKQYVPDKIDDKLIANVAKVIVESGRNYALDLHRKGKTTPPLMYEWHENKYLGAAHGVAGILYLLLQVKDYLEPGVLEKEIKPTIDFLIGTRFPSGNFPSSLGRDRDRLVQWCHGAPGFIHLFVAAARVFISDDYLKVAKECADVTWERGILTKGYSICHGISGNAFAILHLYQYTKDPLYLYRACKFASIIMDPNPHMFSTPDHPFSMFEGTAGVLHFLFSLLKPEQARFPGFQVDSFEQS